MKNLNVKNVRVRLSGEGAHEYDIRVGTGLLQELGTFARAVLPEKTAQICIISNPKIFQLYGEAAISSLKKGGFQSSVWLMKDGERHKSWQSLEKALKYFSEQKLSRSDAVIALGGGVVGDLSGFAAAIYLRGIPFVQVPTTVLAQIDSSVGGKTAINTNFGKNLIGAFHQPSGVLIDLEALKTLPNRELGAGFCEAIKHGILAGEKLFEQTASFLQNFPLKSFKQNFSASDNSNFISGLQDLISANISFKAEIVAGDERENTNREDGRSRRILNLGHTVGHAIEKITDYRRFKHGEAVGYGLLVAAEISNKLGKLSKHELKLFYDVLRLAGSLPNAKDLTPDEIIEAFTHDKKVIGDSFKWILPTTIGQVEILDSKNIPETVVRESLRAVLQD